MAWLIPSLARCGGPEWAGSLERQESWTMRQGLGSGILFRNILGLALLAATGAARLAQNAVDVKL
jgi:hypothetical protein